MTRFLPSERETSPLASLTRNNSKSTKPLTGSNNNAEVAPAAEKNLFLFDLVAGLLGNKLPSPFFLKEKTMSTDVTNRPILSIQLGVVDAAAWRNTDDQGKSRGVSVSLSKRYYDSKEQQWKSTRCYLAPHEIAAAVSILTELQLQLMALDPATLGDE